MSRQGPLTAEMPRLGPWIVRRPRLEEWLGRFRSAPVRFVIAPPGFGKSVTLVSYLRNSPAKSAYCPIPPLATAADVWSAIARVLGADSRIGSHEEAIRAIRRAAPGELALDCEQLPRHDGAAAILGLIEDLGDDVPLLVASQSRAAFDVARLVSRGTASLCDAERLAFAVDEIRHLAETCSVRFAHADVVRLLEVTDGWPQVVSGTIRKAAEDSRGLYGAFDHWRKRHGHLFKEFIDAGLAYAPKAEADLVRKLMSGARIEDREQLQSLEEQGFFVIHTPDGYRPLQALSRTRGRDSYALGSQVPSPLHVSLFGWFRAEIDRRPVPWIRRRDRQVFKYLALQPGSTASRSELALVFWPGAGKHQAAQSLRTVCTNIRKAIAHVVGFDLVEHYFRASDDVCLDLNNVVIDVHAFLSHARDGDEQYERGELQAAYAHYRSAEQVYDGNLLIGDRDEPWLAAQAALLERRHAVVVARLAELVGERQAQPIFERGARLVVGS
jgi:hypothetical protein